MNTAVKNISGFAKRATRSDLLRYNIIYGVGTIGAGVLNYLYQMVVARLLGPADFAVVASLIAIMPILFIPGSPFTTVAMKYVSSYAAHENRAAIKAFISTMTKYLVPMGIGLSLVFMAVSVPIARFLKLSSPIPVILIGLTATLSFAYPLSKGSIQGLKRFTSLSTVLIIESGTKVLLSVAAILAGLSVNGVIAAAFFSMLIAYSISFIPLRDSIGKGTFEVHIGELGGYTGAVLMNGLACTLLMSMDIPLVKHFFSAGVAGSYAAVSTVGKIIFFVTMPVGGVLFPMISERHARDERYVHLMNGSLALVCVVAVVALTAYALFPSLIIGILYGAKFLHAANLLVPLGLLGTLLSIISLFTSYFLSIGDRRFLPMLVAAPIAAITLVFFFHSTLLVVVGIIISVMAALVAAFAVMYTKQYLDQR